MSYKNIIQLCLFVLLCALLASPLQAQQRCQPPTAPSSSQLPNIFTEQQEVDLGDAIAEHIQHEFRVIEDEEVTGYLKRIGERIIKHIPPTNLRFQFFLVDLPEANAFVLPGGRIYVSRKLISYAQSEDELAGVLSHEMGHLVARQGSIDMTRLFKEVLGVTQVTTRQDIFEKYNQLMDNVARKPKAFKHGDEEADQIVADQIGLFALASAGYDPQAHARLYDRLAETKGKTGGFFSDLFGTTNADQKRLREMLRNLAALPASCIEARVQTPVEEFQKWQAAVVNYTGLGRRDDLHAVVWKKTLEPPLRGDITHLRFSPDGKYILAQDDGGINVLTREPFAPLFRIDANEASLAQFTPDSQSIIFYNSGLRVEVWNVADEKLQAVHEMVIRKVCLQTQLAPDGKTLACLDSDLNLNLFDVATNAQILLKKSFYTPSFLDVIILKLIFILNNEDAGDREVDWVNMGFSPDAHYFAAGSRNLDITMVGTVVNESSALAFDLTTRTNVPLKGQLKTLISGGFTFVGPDRLVGINREEYQKSALVSFPAGEVIQQYPLGRARLAAPTRGNYLFIRPVAKFPVGVMDMNTKTVFKANKQSAIDIYDQVFVAERLNGELALYGVEKNDLRGRVVLPRNPLGRLRTAMLSSDMKWLAVSERTRGAVWDLTSGERIFHLRGFRGAYFDNDGMMYADFPKYEETERNIARVDLNTRQVAAGQTIEADRASQFGPFIVNTKPAKKEGGFNENVIIDVLDARTMSSLWSRTFPKEAPDVWVHHREGTMVLVWDVKSEAAKAAIKADAQLTARMAALKEKEGDYYLEVLDAHTGKGLGRLLIETGKGSFRISNIFNAGDWIVITDTLNRVLVYSLSTGEQKGKTFGNRAAVSKTSGLLCVENERGKLAIYDLNSMEKRDQFTFSSPVSLASFSEDGKQLFVLTANQTAYVLDVSAAAHAQASSK